MIDYIGSVKGAIYGFAIGDAMGATTEFMTKRAIAERYGRVEDIQGGGWLGIEAGQITDDTQMSMCVYRGIKDNIKDPLPSICKEFHAWLASNPIDIGSTCLRAISSAKTDDPAEWVEKSEQRQQCGKHDYGNGGLMRCLVPCLLGDLELAVAQSQLTHCNSTCDEAVTLYYNTLWSAIKGEKPYHTNLMKPSGHVWNTLTNARYWFNTAPSLREAIIGAVNDGGDADTIAALAGGLAGAYYGIDGIPEIWIKKLDESVRKQLDECCSFILNQSGFAV